MQFKYGKQNYKYLVNRKEACNIFTDTETNYVARISYFLAGLPLAALLGLAPIFLDAGFLIADFLAKDTFLVAVFIAAEAFLAGTLTSPAFWTTFLAVFLGALKPT